MQGLRDGGDVLGATVQDADESELMLDYIWMNGADILKVDSSIPEGDISEITLSTGNAVRDDSITCHATVSDPHGGQSDGQMRPAVLLEPCLLQTFTW